LIDKLFKSVAMEQGGIDVKVGDEMMMMMMSWWKVDK
jgi:hypothetical protein